MMIGQTEQTRMFQQISDFQKTAVDASFKTMEMFQNRVDRMMNLFIEHSRWASEKWGTAMTDCTRVYKEGYENMMKTANEKVCIMGFPFKN
ncbi:MAG: hypothetical protein AB7S75_12255 [Desulfococcaceae bacterium]